MKPTAAKTVSSQLIYRNHGRKAASFFILLILACVATCASAETYYFTGTSDYADYSDSANWRIGGPDGSATSTIPGTSDSLYTLSPIYADMAGGDYSVGSWGFAEDWDHSPKPLYVRNGTLRITSNLTTHSGALVMSDGGNIYVEGTYIPAIWDAGAHVVTVNDGCTYGITGPYKLYKTQVTVKSGGEFLFNPTSFEVHGGTAQSSWYDIYGMMYAPSGVKWTSGGFDNDSCSMDFRLQDGGFMLLGSGFSRTPSTGKLKFTWYSGGTLSVTGAVSFVNTEAMIENNASVTLVVGDGGSIDFSEMTIGTGVTVTKTGSGDFVFTNGMTIPDTFVVAGGSLALTSAGSYDISGVAFSGGNVKIGAPGVTLTGWGQSFLSDGGFVAGIAAPVVGSTLFTCTDATVLAMAQTGLNATLPEGFSVAVDGNSLVVSSSYVFDSTTVTDLNDPTGWVGGSVPVGKVVTIKGAGVAPTTTALPAFAGITIMDGASLTIANGGTLPAVTLSDSAALTLASGDFALGGTLSTQPSGGYVPAITIASGSTLSVPGGTTFTDCSLNVGGVLAVSSAGGLNLGYAAAGATASFGLTVTGVISNGESAVNFFCPASGGTVVPIGNVVFMGATFMRGDNGTAGFNFCNNNPNATAVEFVFDNTTLNYPLLSPSEGYAISGGARLTFRNGGCLYRADNSGYNHCLLNVTGLARLVLEEGTSSRFGMSANGQSAGNGFISFSPDTDGFPALVISNAAWEAHHAEGNSKAVVEVFGNSAHPISYKNWNWKMPFYHAKSVHLNDGAVLAITNNTDTASMDFSETFTGAGSLFFSTPRSTTRTFNFNSTTSTATGTLAADPAKNDALVIAPTATWGGTVVWNGKASINHSATADAMIFGGIDLAADFNIRIWGGDSTCDHYTLTGAGFIDNGACLGVTVADGVEPEEGDSFTIARVPADSFVPSVRGSAWTISTKTVEGDNTVVDIVLAPAVSDYVFESDGVADLCAAAGWATASVPTNQDVKVSGATTIATITDASAFPEFASIAVRNGATLKVLSDVTLPPLTIDATSKVVFGDGAAAVSAALNASLTTACSVSGGNVALPVIEIATNATLTVTAGMKFKNVDFRLCGTVSKDGTDTISPTFGYAENGETSYLAFTADGGTFDFHANNNDREFGAVRIVNPASDGTVIPVGTITLRNTVRDVRSWADFGSWEFGVNNPTNVPFEVLVDGTHIDVSGDFYASGAAHLTLVNGSFIRRNDSCLGHWFPMAIQDAATIIVGEGCYIDFTTNDGQFGIDSQSAVDAVTVVSGGVYSVSQNSSGWGRGIFVSDGGILGVTKKSSRDQTDLLRGFGSARLDGDLFIQSINIGTGLNDWDRHTKMANVPFAGTGDVTITNGVPAYPFTVTMVNGASTATGSITVDKVEGDAETALYFADGANWAGTVVAGNVLLTNLTDGVDAATATFGTLDLAADFNIRVWAENGVVVTNDMVNVGQYRSSGGRLSIELMSEGLEFVAGDKIVVGTIAKSSPNPAVRVGWCVKRLAIDGDDENEILVMKKGVGLQLILR